ncbi:MAG: UDP-N-acetylglucosamine 1-carboxyvinyltransferase [Armatimonadetes bacterium]|nr:UDP-N-acetylglucosamine 1-carboxyvinyltransferase [Armatimonadota bacterium]
MDKIIVTGGCRLEGTVPISGSKNSTLAIMAGALLARGKIVLRNVPRVGDVYTMVEMLRYLGATVEINGCDVVTIDATYLNNREAPYELVKKMRASFWVLGSTLARTGYARVALPGGCDIGARPVDFHIKGIQQLGAQVSLEHGFVEATASQLRGSDIYFDFPSVGATAHLMITASLARGITTIENAAQEPEIVDLARFLNALGARIQGMGTKHLQIEGVDELYGNEYTIIPDRMEAGTFAIAAMATGGDIFLRNAFWEDMQPVLSKLEEAGTSISLEWNGIRVEGPDRPHATDIKTMPHPGFPTDMQQPMTALLSVADGTSIINETLYESRFKYAQELARMGADIKIEGRSAIIKGVPRLTGAPVVASDLRAGAALVIAGLMAEGETEIASFHHVDRGYERLEEKLCALGAQTQRFQEWVEGEELCSV